MIHHAFAQRCYSNKGGGNVVVFFFFPFFGSLQVGGKVGGAGGGAGRGAGAASLLL